MLTPAPASASATAERAPGRSFSSLTVRSVAISRLLQKTLVAYGLHGFICGLHGHIDLRRRVSCGDVHLEAGVEKDSTPQQLYSKRQRRLPVLRVIGGLVDHPARADDRVAECCRTSHL